MVQLWKKADIMRSSPALRRVVGGSKQRNVLEPSPGRLLVSQLNAV